MANNTISDSTESNILKLVFNATTWTGYAVNDTGTPEANIVWTLNTGANVLDTDAANANEAAYTGYARVNTTRNAATLPVTGTNPTQMNPASAITFGLCTALTATVTTFTTTKSGGGASPVLWGGLVSPNISVSNGVTPQLTTATSIQLD